MNLPRRILLSPSSDGSSPSSTSSRQIHTSVFIAAASAVFAAFFLALIYYSILRRRHRSSVTPTLSDDVTITPSRASRDHPFWHVKTVGLPGSAIESLGSHCHVSGGVADVASCSVCLTEVCDGEVVRVLPHCGHLFHVHCVDTWLRCHVSCPLCRAPVVVGPTVEEEEEEEEEDGSQTMVRVSVEVAESSGGGSLRSASMDSVAMRGFQEGEGSEKGKEKEEGSESERKLWFSRLGRTKSSSVLPL